MKQSNVKISSSNTKNTVIKEQKPVTKEHWLKDNVKSNTWIVYYVPECTYTPKVVNLFKEHKEDNVQFIVYSELSAQEAINKGRNFSPCIFQNGKLFGSLGDLENYYKRNFFSTMRQAIS